MRSFFRRQSEFDWSRYFDLPPETRKERLAGSWVIAQYDQSHMTRDTTMTAPVSKPQLKVRALEYFRLVETQGERLVVTDHGVPKLEIRRYQTSAACPPLERLRGSVLRYDQPSEPAAENDWDALRLPE